jgi:hypothetical protein
VRSVVATRAQRLRVEGRAARGQNVVSALLLVNSQNLQNFNLSVKLRPIDCLGMYEIVQQRIQLTRAVEPTITDSLA